MNSGFLSVADSVSERSMSFCDVEVVALGKTQFVARGARYGRLWLLKGIRQEFSGDVLLRQQLIKEFEILSMLSHPNIVNFAGMEEVDGLGLCIVTEWIEGQTLEQALHDGSLERSDRRRLLMEIAEGVAYLHSKGIVHRDLKPSNIMVRQNGRSAVIIDFGCADTDAYTIVKFPAGTPGYASERQQYATTPATSDDVYSLGVIMRSLYPEYAAIARRCESATGHRYENAGQLLRAIRRRSRRGFQMWVAAALVAAVSVIAVLGYQNLRLRKSVASLDGQIERVMQSNERDRVAGLRGRERLNDSLSMLKKQLEVESGYRMSVERHEARMAALKRALEQQSRSIYAKFRKDLASGKVSERFKGERLSALLAENQKNFIARQKGLTDKDRQDLYNANNECNGEIMNGFLREND